MPMSVSQFKREVIEITTDSLGAATVYSQKHRARILGLIYTKTDFANGVDFTITTESTAITAWTESDVNAAKSVFPTMLVQDEVGVDTTQRDYIPLCDERLKIVIAQGGDTTTGTITLLFDG